MEPIAPYEQRGLLRKRGFTDGAILRGEELWIYYGASDTVTCLAKIELGAVWEHLGV